MASGRCPEMMLKIDSLKRSAVGRVRTPWTEISRFPFKLPPMMRISITPQYLFDGPKVIFKQSLELLQFPMEITALHADHFCCFGNVVIVLY